MIGWVIGGAAAARALSWGALRAWRSYSSSRVEAVPRFINTPIDYLAASLFDLIGGLSIIVAREAGELDEAERAAVMDYFQGEWGIDPEYIAAALPALEESTLGASVRDAAKALADYKRNNPDCDYGAMATEVLRFLKEIAEADGALDTAELDAITAVEATFREENRWGVWKAATSAAFPTHPRHSTSARSARALLALLLRKRCRFHPRLFRFRRYGCWARRAQARALSSRL
jgi:uncharacterized membrane protein YebE (DUF533 family)